MLQGTVAVNPGELRTSASRFTCANAFDLHLSRRHAVNGSKEVKALIGLAVPDRPIGPWSRRTGAPEASATGRDRNRGRAGAAHHLDHADNQGHWRTAKREVSQGARR